MLENTRQGPEARIPESSCLMDLRKKNWAFHLEAGVGGRSRDGEGSKGAPSIEARPWPPQRRALKSPFQQKDTREVVAIKCVAKKSLNKASVENLLTEIEILKGIRHPHIVQLKDFQVWTCDGAPPKWLKKGRTL